MLLRNQTESPGAEDDMSPEERAQTSPPEDRDSVATDTRSPRKRQPSEKAKTLPGGRVRKPYKDFFIWRDHQDLEAMILKSGLTAHTRSEEFNNLLDTINSRLEAMKRPLLSKQQLSVSKGKIDG